MNTNTVETAQALTDKLATGWQGQVAEGRETIDQSLAWLSDKGVDFLFNAVIALAMLLLGALAIRLIEKLVRKALTRNGKKKTLFTDFVSSVTVKACWAVLTIMVLGRLGVNVAPLIAGLGVTGFILGFAFQESLGNLASGMMIAINEPFKVGDFVEIAGFAGTVNEVNMMATVLATGDNKKIVVPNKSAWGSPIVNYSALGKRRVDLTVGISYGSDIAKAIEIATRTVSAIPGVLAEPALRVAPSSLDDSAVTLVVRPWVNAADYWTVHAAALKAVKEAFDREGISIPFPQLDVHVDKA